MNKIKVGVASAMFMLSALNPATVTAADVFTPINTSKSNTSQTYKLQANESIVGQYKLNTQVISKDSAQLDFNLLPNLSVQAKKVSAEFNNQGSLVWKGKLANSKKTDDSTLTDNSVIFVKRDTGITGTLRVDGRLFKIRPLGHGQHVVLEVNEAKMPEDHPPGEMSILEQKAQHNFDQLYSQSSAPTTSATAEIKILVAYTAAAKNAVSDIQGLIELAVAETNTGYSNSGVNATMTLAHTYQVNYTESNFSTDLSYFRNNNDGVMDEVHGKRDQYGADVAMIMTNVNDYCGLASAIGANSATAFAAVYHGCATGYYSFGHEVGHLQAARHDPNNDPTTTPYAFGHGYQYAAGGWRTIMAYNCSGGCTRINWWSNPNKTRGGVPMGTSSQSDNARVLNITSPIMADFKGGSTPPPGDGELTNGQAETNLSGSQGSQQFFYLDVPSSANSLSFQMSGGSGDADMYVKFGSQPTTSSYDCRPYLNGNNETCNISNVQSGRYYVMLRGYSSFSGVSLVGNFSEGSSGGTFSKSNLSDSRGNWKHYSVTIPSGMSSFDINMSGGSGDADLYVRRGSQPTTSRYDCRPYRNGNSESCSFNNPASGTWYISVRAYSNYSGVNINAEWN